MEEIDSKKTTTFNNVKYEIRCILRHEIKTDSNISCLKTISKSIGSKCILRPEINTERDISCLQIFFQNPYNARLKSRKYRACSLLS